MDSIFVENCPRCSTPINKELNNRESEISCPNRAIKCGYLLSIEYGKISSSYYYGDVFVYASEKIGETAFNDDKVGNVIWIKRVLHPLITNAELDNILLLL